MSRRSYQLMMRVSSVAVFAMHACTGGADPRRIPEAVHTDSSGVDIVVNSIAAAAVPVFATLDSVAALRLGTLDGPQEEQFGSVNDVLPLPDGGVAVLDGQSAEIRLFDSDGAYRLSLGSKGQGPGELQSPIKLGFLSGDTLAVYDARARRITRYGLDGALGRTTSLKDTRARIVAAGFLADGRFIGQSRWLAPGGAPVPGPELTFVRDTAVLTLFATDGAVDDTVDVVPARESIMSVKANGGSISVFRRSPAFGRTNVFAVHPDGVWSAANDRFELRLREVESGRLLRIVRAPGLEKPVSDAVARTIRDQALAEAETPDDRRRTEAWYALSARPETEPAFDLFIVDDQARLWVHAWSSVAGLATRWWVFSAGGDLLGSVEAPGGLRITSVGCGWVWGIEHDELDVGYAVRYALRGVDHC